MNAADRTNQEYAHRGQRITLDRPPQRDLQVGERVQITFDAPHAWLMPATVIEVGVTGVRVEPGAAVSHPEKWRLVYAWETADALRMTTVAGSQFDLFAGASA